MPTIPYKNAAGKKISGSTTIIGGNLGWNKEALKYWAWSEGIEGRNYKDTVKKAADSGTVAHYLIECDIKEVKPDLNVEFAAVLDSLTPEVITKAERSFYNFLNWKKQMKIVVVETEPHLVSERYQYGLTPDAIIRVGGKKGKLGLFDWKTGKGLYADHLIQLASYRYGWEENHPDMILEEGYHLLRIEKETAAWHHHHWERDGLDPAWEVFLYLLEIHSRKKILEGMAA